MKVLFISNLYPPHVLGGYEIICEQVCDALRKRGHEVVVLTTDHGIDGFATPDDPAYIHRPLRLYVPFNRPAGLMRNKRWAVGRRNYRATDALIGAERPDVIFIWSQLRLTVGPARAAEASGIPVAYTFNDLTVAGYVPGPFSLRPRGLVRYILERVVFPSTTLQGLKLAHTTCISRRLKDALVEKGVPIANARIIYQAIFTEDFPPKAEPGNISVPARILYVGQLHDYKGVHTVIEAANLVGRDDPGLIRSVSIVGDGTEHYKRRLRDLAAKGPTKVDFPGKVPHDKLADVYQKHDILVFPSTWVEAFGLTHLEAMACGTPVISTKRGGHGEIMKDGENALLFDEEDAGQLAAQLKRLIKEPDLGRNIARNARAMVEKEFTMERYFDDLESFLTGCEHIGEPVEESGK